VVGGQAAAEDLVEPATPVLTRATEWATIGADGLGARLMTNATAVDGPRGDVGM
jgi:hypothetical protein